MLLRDKMIPCQSREAVVTVLSYQDGVLEGYLQHPRLKKREKIHSLSQTVLLLNSLLDLEDGRGNPLPLVISERDDMREKLAVFSIQVLFRENYTWQGKLIWLDQKKETVFRSAMELIQIMDEILA